MTVEYMNMVREFHERFGHISNHKPTLEVSKTIQLLRLELIKEEWIELSHALEADDIVEVADAIGDLLYVTFGAALVFGLPMDRIFEVIHQSNMSKLDEDGKPILRIDGKVMKSKNYSAPTPHIKALLGAI